MIPFIEALRGDKPMIRGDKPMINPIRTALLASIPIVAGGEAVKRCACRAGPGKPIPVGDMCQACTEGLNRLSAAVYAWVHGTSSDGGPPDARARAKLETDLRHAALDWFMLRENGILPVGAQSAEDEACPCASPACSCAKPHPNKAHPRVCEACGGQITTAMAPRTPDIRSVTVAGLKLHPDQFTVVSGMVALKNCEALTILAEHNALTINVEYGFSPT